MRVLSPTIAAILFGSFQTEALAESALHWTALPPLADTEGFAGMYAGVSGGTLIAAGGTQFENGVPWWDGGKKIWSGKIHVLDRAAGRWVVANEQLPKELGDGLSVSYGDEMICIGGGDETTAYADVFALRFRSG